MMHDAPVDSFVWYACGPGDVCPARVAEVVDAETGVLDLEVYKGRSAHTENPMLPMGPEDFEPMFGPPTIILDESDEDWTTEDKDSVPYNPNGTTGSWHEP